MPAAWNTRTTCPDGGVHVMTGLASFSMVASSKTQLDGQEIELVDPVISFEGDFVGAAEAGQLFGRCSG